MQLAVQPFPVAGSRRIDDVPLILNGRGKLLQGLYQLVYADILLGRVGKERLQHTYRHLRVLALGSDLLHTLGLLARQLLGQQVGQGLLARQRELEFFLEPVWHHEELLELGRDVEGGEDDDQEAPGVVHGRVEDRLEVAQENRTLRGGNVLVKLNQVVENKDGVQWCAGHCWPDRRVGVFGDGQVAHGFVVPMRAVTHHPVLPRGGIAT
mmetsp:Transcript_30499/g.75710  ORF Transcript_30499/g.75710 Transcript_30499/m.75710 type:complete len:210 (+) Transcript_30499:229-858(+)